MNFVTEDKINVVDTHDSVDDVGANSRGPILKNFTEVTPFSVQYLIDRLQSLSDS